MKNVNITFAVPGDHELVEKLGRVAVLRLGRQLWKTIWAGLTGQDRDAARLVGPILALIRRQAGGLCAEAIANYDDGLARQAVDALAALANAIEAMPEEARPSGAKFWLDNGHLYADRYTGLGQVKSSRDQSWSEVYPMATRAEAALLANALGGDLLSLPPSWWVALRDRESEGEL